MIFNRERTKKLINIPLRTLGFKVDALIIVSVENNSREIARGKIDVTPYNSA